MTVLNLANERQRIIFEFEMQGQISDGMWENTRPYDHYKPWSNCEVKVDPNNLGRNFYAPKDNYNFASSELLKAVGERIALKVAFYYLPEEAMRKLPHYVEDLENDWYWGKYGEELQSRYGLTPEIIKDTAKNYTIKDLKKDCKELMQVIRIKNNTIRG